MLLPYLTLSLATLALGLGFPVFSDALSSMSLTTLSLFEALRLEVALKPLTAALVGGTFASAAMVVAAYLVAGYDFRRLIESSRLAAAIHGFLYDRMYVNPLIYLVVAGSFSWLSGALLELDLLVDFTYHSALVAAGSLAAIALRRIHRGRTDYILALYLVSLALALLYAAFTARSYLEGILAG
jgi:NADH-quinone oxidoreductase subunit L